MHVPGAGTVRAKKAGSWGDGYWCPILHFVKSEHSSGNLVLLHKCSPSCPLLRIHATCQDKLHAPPPTCQLCWQALLEPILDSACNAAGAGDTGAGGSVG